MILTDVLEQIRNTKISGSANGSPVDTIELCFGGRFDSSNDRFIIEAFDGDKIKKHTFKKLDDITSNLLQARLVKWNIILRIQNNGFDFTTIEFVVSI